jgi:hypothetical protein
LRASAPGYFIWRYFVEISRQAKETKRVSYLDLLFGTFEEYISIR